VKNDEFSNEEDKNEMDNLLDHGLDDLFLGFDTETRRDKIVKALHTPSGLSENLLRHSSNATEFERLASQILNEQSKIESKGGSRNFSESKFKNGMSAHASHQRKLEEAELVYMENIDNQPDEKVVAKRK